MDEVNCVVLGLSDPHIDYFYEEYGKFAANHFFNPKFQLGVWDGKIRYFQKKGTTYVYLLDDIIPRITRLGYKIELDDKRQMSTCFPPKITEDFFGPDVLDPDGKPWKFRDYQVDMINSMTEYGYGVGIAGTGGGKTSITAAIALSYERHANFKSMIIVPDRGLTIQTIEEYKHFGLDVGEYSGKVKDIQHQHVVSTWQALKNNPTILLGFDMIVVDECHGLRGAVLTKLMTENGKHIPHRFGVTGTLPKEETDAMAVQLAVGPVRYTIPAHQLIAEGHLSKLKIDMLQHNIDLKEDYNSYLEHEYTPLDGKPLTYIKFKDGYFTDFAAEKRFLGSQKDRLGWMAEYIQLKSEQPKGNTLVLVNSIAAGKKLAKIIPDSHFVYGKDDAKVRKDVYDLFKENDNVVAIATVNIASTGLNIPRIFNLVFIDMGKSFIRVIQSIGRGLRKAHDKDYVHVTDLCSDLKYSKKHAAERIKYYKEAKYPYKKTVVDIDPDV